MSKHRHRASAEAGSNALTTAQTPQPIPEKTMETNPQDTPKQAETPQPSVAEGSAPTAKQLAAMEEENAARLQKLVAQQQQPPEAPPMALSEAAKGHDALHEAFRQHNEKAKMRKEYVPPPRTERQMTALQE